MQHGMAYPRDQQATGLAAGVTKPKQSNPELHGHFDADELTRRLEKVLKDRKLHTERKQAIRAAAVKMATDQNSRRKDAESLHLTDGKPSATVASQSVKSSTIPGNLIADLRSKSVRFSMRRSSKSNLKEVGSDDTATYHHVPKEAASQFSRTTTVDNMHPPGSTHKLAKHALKYHKEGVKKIRSAIADPTLTASELPKVLRHDQYQRQKNLDRNQFQRTRFLEEAAEIDEEREKEKQLCAHTWEGELARLRADDRPQQEQKQSRRRSTGDVLLGKTEELGRRSMVVMQPLADNLEDATPLPELPERFLAKEHRIDWTQEDQTYPRRSRLFLQPILRRADSIWTLSGIRGSKESPTQVPEIPALPSSLDSVTPKSTKSGFFAKLKPDPGEHPKGRRNKGLLGAKMFPARARSRRATEQGPLG